MLMLNPDLYTYVRDELQKGIDVQLIRENVLKAGWTEEQVDEVLINTPLQSPQATPIRSKNNAWISNVQLIATNVIVIYLAVVQKWSVLDVFLVYWIQSMIIGLFYFVKLWYFKSNAFFFITFYGFFHFIYLVAILAISRDQTRETSVSFYQNSSAYIDFPKLILPTIAFFCNHLVSFITNFKKDVLHPQHNFKLSSYPMTRIFPMHIALTIGVSLGFPTIVFLIIRAVIDYALHVLAHLEDNPPVTSNKAPLVTKFHELSDTD
jgi:hypothetical protein